MLRTGCKWLAVPLLVVVASYVTLAEDDPVIDSKRFSLPDGLTIEKVADPSLVKRPINCAFDDQGNLYVTESSGTNDNVQLQLKNRPHRVLKLTDSDGDGIYDRRTVFAESLMFPEGIMFHEGSVYVCAPPQIWKLTDRNQDGIAEERVVWFDGKTLTGCANDLHGPYLGPDGWIYWCKGAFAEQKHELVNGRELVSRASHIFRRHPKGGPLEPVMTGGMDNPVELVFTADGERVFNCTFLQHPLDGKRDGLIHAIYGGVYGKEHGVLDGHPRTGRLMPVMVHQDASAPSGLVRLESEQLGQEFRNNVLCTSFNMHKVFRHRLKYDGSLLTTELEDFLVCHSLDFHPTDVIEDADGSVLIVDTGGWYKLCCPTSQLHKPDILGGIYRVRRKDHKPGGDPWGNQIDWESINPCDFLDDKRPMVRRRALQQAVKDQRTNDLADVLDAAREPSRRLEAVWALARIAGRDPGRIDQTAARFVRKALKDTDSNVRQAAAHCGSVLRDKAAVADLIELLNATDSANRRVAAEALGRLEDDRAVAAILQAANHLEMDKHNPSRIKDRGLEHSLIYALIELDRVDLTAAGIRSASPTVRHVAMMAISQSSRIDEFRETVINHLDSADPLLRSDATWIVAQHRNWSGYLKEHVRRSIQNRSGFDTGLLDSLLNAVEIQQIVMEHLGTVELGSSIAHNDLRLIDLIAGRKLQRVDPLFRRVVARMLESSHARVIESGLSLVVNNKQMRGDGIDQRLRSLLDEPSVPADSRLEALNLLQPSPWTDKHLTMVVECMNPARSFNQRTLAVDALRQATLEPSQLEKIAGFVDQLGPVELPLVLDILSRKSGDSVGLKIVGQLKPVAGKLPLDADRLSTILKRFGDQTVREGKSLLNSLRETNRAKYDRLNRILTLVDKADIRKGQKLFHSNRANCITCHQMGYLGGRIGPSLTRIGNIRSSRDLLEAVMYPSASFVRSFEPTLIATVDGRQYNGILANETADSLELILDAQKRVVIDRKEIEARRTGSQSIMPSGLDQQFSDQDLANLIRFLKESR